VATAPTTESGAAKASCLHCSVKTEHCESVRQHDLEETMLSLSSSVRPWHSGGFNFVRKLQDAERNHGQVDEMTGKDEAVAVKKMPNWWVQPSHEDFSKKYPKEVERPWWDISIMKELQHRRFPYVCNLFGIFRDQDLTYVVSSLATEGDLFGWSQRQPMQPETRETALQPVVAQIFDAVRWLHDLGIAHRDLSLENILVTSVAACVPQVKLIDFGMSRLGRMCKAGSKLPGKDIFRAPEVYGAAEYDAFLADAFAFGVVVYGMTLLDYPWQTTTPGKMGAFNYTSTRNTEVFLRTQKVRGQFLRSFLSPSLLSLMAGLLAAPEKRFCLGEDCLMEEGHVCACSGWLARAAPLEKRGLSSSSLSTMAPSDVDSD